MGDVRLAAQERLLAAFARYDAVWSDGPLEELPATRYELCLALIACGEALPSPVMAQMDRDRAALERIHGLPALRLMV